MAVGGVDDQGVDTCIDERASALPRVVADAEGGGDAEAAPVVLRCVRELDLLLDVFDRDQPSQLSVAVDDRELLDLVAVEDRLGFGKGGADRRGDEVARGHQRRHRLDGIGGEPKVAVRQDPDERSLVIGDRDTRDVVPGHQGEGLRHERVRRQRHRLDDHAGLAPLHLVHLGDLIVDREIAVEDADPALTRERDREPGLGDGVHRRRDNRNRKLDALGEVRPRRNVVRQDARLRRNEQHIVEREPFLGELPLEGEEPLDVALRELQFLHRAMVPTGPDGPRRAASYRSAITGSSSSTLTL